MEPFYIIGIIIFAIVMGLLLVAIREDSMRSGTW